MSVVQQAYVEGVSTWRVDDSVKALGCDGIAKSQVSRICRDLDEVVENFLSRPLAGGPYPYIWLDALTQNPGMADASSMSAWWWPPASTHKVIRKCWAWTWAPVGMAPSGRVSCVR